MYFILWVILFLCFLEESKRLLFPYEDIRKAQHAEIEV